MPLQDTQTQTREQEDQTKIFGSKVQIDCVTTINHNEKRGQ